MTNEQLVSKIQAGQTCFISDLWYAVEKYIWMFANKFYVKYGDFLDKTVISTEDLYQSGYFALLKSADNYSETEGASYISYLSYYLLSEFENTSGLKTKYKQVQFDKSVISLDKPIDEDSDNELFLIDTIPDTTDDYSSVEERLYYQSIHKKIDAFLDDALNPIHADIIKESYWHNASLEKLAEKYGKSAHCISSTKTSALSFLKHNYKKFRSGRELKSLLPVNYYGGTGLKSYQTNGCSIQEKILLLYERLGLTGT